MKLPEPFLLFDTQQKTVHFLIPTRIDVPMTVVIELMKLYTEAQLKQAVSDALEAAAKVCDAQVEAANRHVCKSKSRKADDIYSAVAQTAHTSRIAIRKLKEGL